MSSASRIQSLLLRWRLRRAVAGGVLGVGIAGLALALWFGGGGAALGGWLIAVAGLLAGFLPSLPRADADALARHLDRRVPALEESAQLLLVHEATLTPLQRLQRARAAAVLGELGGRHLLPWRTSVLAVAGGLGCLLVGLALRGGASGSETPPASATSRAIAAAGVTRMREVTVTVAPPAYTGRATHRSSGLEAVVEEGAVVRWQVLLDGPAERAELALGDEQVTLSRGAGGTWDGEIVARTSAIYALRVEAQGRQVLRSPSARMEVVPDRPPLVEIVRPPTLTEVREEALGTLELEARAGDDYGLGAVELLVTTVTGGGEQVVFREERLPLTAAGGGRFLRALDLAALGVRKDTELYLRIEAADRRTPQPNRALSQTVRVRVPGATVVPSAALDAGLALQPVLEYFRSQRQIILDTEKLLADQPRIAQREFEQRSQDLAFDQRALRLRYGALLGEEFESGSAVEAGGEGGVAGSAADPAAAGEDADEAGKLPKKPGAPKAPVNAMDVVPHGLVHAHDTAETASYFSSELRTQLKAVLSEMWGAEGGLRVFTPRKALPFEYRALRLLKDLQQRARVYVPKIGYEAPEIDLKRRLTGELDSVRDLSAPAPEARPFAAAEVRRVLAFLDRPAAASAGELALSDADFVVVERALRQAALTSGDSDALSAVDNLRALQAAPAAPLTPAALAPATLTSAALAPLRRSLWRLLPVPQALPAGVNAGSALERSFRARQGGTP